MTAPAPLPVTTATVPVAEETSLAAEFAEQTHVLQDTVRQLRLELEEARRAQQSSTPDVRSDVHAAPSVERADACIQTDSLQRMQTSESSLFPSTPTTPAAAATAAAAEQTVATDTAPASINSAPRVRRTLGALGSDALTARSSGGPSPAQTGRSMMSRGAISTISNLLMPLTTPHSDAAAPAAATAGVQTVSDGTSPSLPAGLTVQVPTSEPVLEWTTLAEQLATSRTDAPEVAPDALLNNRLRFAHGRPAGLPSLAVIVCERNAARLGKAAVQSAGATLEVHFGVSGAGSAASNERLVCDGVRAALETAARLGVQAVAVLCATVEQSSALSSAAAAAAVVRTLRAYLSERTAPSTAVVCFDPLKSEAYRSALMRWFPPAKKECVVM